MAAAGALGIDDGRSPDLRPVALRPHPACPDGRCSRCPTRTAWSTSPGVSTSSASSWSRPAARPRAMREAGLPVTDVAAVTGSPEMLDGRVKTLHPRIHGGILADLRLPQHRGQLAHANIDPFEVVAVNLYRFADAAARPGHRHRRAHRGDRHRRADAGAGRGQEPCQRGHPHRPAPVPGRARGAGRRRARVSEATRRELALAAFRLTAGYDADRSPPSWPGASGPTARRRGARALPGAPGAAPWSVPRCCATARTRTRRRRCTWCPARIRCRGPLASGATPLQGKPLSYNNLLDAAAAAGLARDLRGAAVVIVKHGNPCGAAEATDLVERLGGRPGGRPGERLRWRGRGQGGRRPGARGAARLASSWRSSSPAPSTPMPGRSWPRKTDLRLLEDPGIVGMPSAGVELRSAGGAVLATDADVSVDLPATWTSVGARPPTDAEMADLDLAWRVCRHVRSNAIVLVRGRRRRGRRRGPDEPRRQRPAGRGQGRAGAGTRRGLRLGRVLPVPRRARGVRRGRASPRSSTPAAPSATRRSSRPRMPPVRRCCSPGSATSATDTGTDRPLRAPADPITLGPGRREDRWGALRLSAGAPEPGTSSPAPRRIGQLDRGLALPRRDPGGRLPDHRGSGRAGHRGGCPPAARSCSCRCPPASWPTATTGA